MGQRRKPGTTRDPAEQERRDQEVLRASRELAAYFKGQRTEREARAALKIVKAFVRDREKLDAASRPPLPGVRVKAPQRQPKRKAGERGERAVRKPHRTLVLRSSKAKSHAPAIAAEAVTDLPQQPASHERTSE